MKNKTSVLIKIGGRAAEAGALTALAREMKALEALYDFILVHGGGAEVTRVSEIFGLKAVFTDGVRQTSPAEMEVVDMVLSGKINKDITRLFRKEGLNAAGLSGSDGGLFTGAALGPETHTGKITGVNPQLLELLLAASYLPVISSTSMEAAGKALNINADEAALALAEAVKPDFLIFISDIPGILKPAGGGEPEVLSFLNEETAGKEIASGVINGGMIPKVRSSLKALKAGVGAVVIGEYKKDGDLSDLIKGLSGTRITV